jgi:hypothetical protein
VRFVASLPLDPRRFGANRVQELTDAVGELLGLGTTAADLRAELSRDLGGIYNPVGVWLHRLAVRRSLLGIAAPAGGVDTQTAVPPCRTDGCHDCEHDRCNRAGFLIDQDVGVRCPCWFAPEARF